MCDHISHNRTCWKSDVHVTVWKKMQICWVVSKVQNINQNQTKELARFVEIFYYLSNTGMTIFFNKFLHNFNDLEDRSAQGMFFKILACDWTISLFHIRKASSNKFWLEIKFNLYKMLLHFDLCFIPKFLSNNIWWKNLYIELLAQL